MIDKLIEQQETIKGMQENEESAIKIMKMYEDYKLRVDKAIEYIKFYGIYQDGHCKCGFTKNTLDSLLNILKGE